VVEAVMSVRRRPWPPGGDRYHLGVRVLFVCTANICRSPMAAALFAAHARRRRVAPEVSSAGIDAGRPSIPDTVPPEVTEVMAGFAIDLGGHRGRELTASALVDADLVIGMGRRHVREAVVLDPASFTRAFTLTELVERGVLVGPRSADQDVGSWIGAVHGDRTRQALGRRSDADDIADPYGGPLAGYRSTASELDRLTGQLAMLLWPEQDRQPRLGGNDPLV
jgi:protein-tyrosine phosphatase